MNNNILIRFWVAYGGWIALVKSKYLWASIILTAVLFKHWAGNEWWDDVLSIMPSLLGFSLGVFALWLAIGDDEFRRIVVGESVPGKTSPYMTVNATFVHFILLQLIAIFLALINKALNFKLPNDSFLLLILGGFFWPIVIFGKAFSYFIFIYALMSALASTFALFRVASWYDLKQTKKIELSDKAGKKKELTTHDN